MNYKRFKKLKIKRIFFIFTKLTDDKLYNNKFKQSMSFIREFSFETKRVCGARLDVTSCRRMRAGVTEKRVENTAAWTAGLASQHKAAALKMIIRFTKILDYNSFKNSRWLRISLLNIRYKIFNNQFYLNWTKLTMHAIVFNLKQVQIICNSKHLN